MSNILKKYYFIFLAIFLVACQPQKEDSKNLKDLAALYPQRIVTLSPHLTELIYSLGAEDRLVATVEYSDYPKEAESIQRIGNAFQLDWEALTTLKPDLIIAWQGGNPEAMLTKLEQHGFNVLRLENAKLYELPTQLEQLASRLGSDKVAEQLSESYLNQLNILKQSYADKRKVKVFYQISAQPIYTIDAQHTISEILRICGAENIFPELGKTSAPVTPEAVVGANPDVILTTTFTYDNVVEQWAGIFLVENIMAVPADEVTRASLRMAQGTKNICEALDEWRLLAKDQ